MTLLRCHRDVLQAIVAAKAVQPFELPDLSGYERKFINYALTRLSELGLIEKHLGFWQPRERGKIALAILVGQETRARSRRQEAA